MAEQIRLSDHFTYGKLLRFTFPSMIMMIFTSIYGVVDGFFISNYVGESAFAAVNFIMPYIMVFTALGFMIGTGGSALISFLLGRNKKEEANRVFSLLVYTVIVIGFLCMFIGMLFLRRIAVLLGARGDMLDVCVRYGRIVFCAMPPFMLQYCFQSFLVAAEKPRLGLAFTVGAGVTNMILDALFMAVFGWGVEGAAVATCIGQCIGGFGPLVYFSLPNKSLLHLGKTRFSARTLGKTASNGAAEFMTNASTSFVNMIYNIQLLRLAGEYGVSAYGIIMYVNFVFVAVFIGYSMGVAPVISFHYGASDHAELKNLTEKSIKFLVLASVIMVCLAEAAARPLARIFAGYDEEFLAVSTNALRLYSWNYIFASLNIFGAAFFAALNNGRVSAVLSAVRVLVFQIAAVLLLPLVLGTNGIWLSIVAAEFCTVILTVACILRFREKYGY